MVSSHSRSAMSLMADVSVVAVIEIPTAGHALPLADILSAVDGIALEVTLRTEAACEAISLIRENYPEMIVGAGTVLGDGDLKKVDDAGAQFAISPGATSALYEAARNFQCPLIPGVATASEIMLGLTYGYDFFKFFPAESAGGVKTLRSFAGPFGSVKFIPTGGITADNASTYLTLDNVVAVGGSWMVPSEAIKHADWPTIRALAEQCATL